MTSPGSSSERGLKPGRYALVNYYLWVRSVQEAPLNQRAWVLQERLLARRILHFTKDQMLWECRTLSASEAYPAGIPAASIYDSDFKAAIFQENAACYKLGLAGFSGYWGDVVQTYTRAILTKPSDRPLAIAGIAEMIEVLKKDKYISGMWREDLCSQLCWYALPPFNDASTRDFPTFSWLGLDCLIVMNARGHRPWCNIESASVRDLEVSSDEIKQKGNITIRGMLKKIHFRRATQLQPDTGHDKKTWHSTHQATSPDPEDEATSPEADTPASNETLYDEPDKPWHLITPETGHSTASLTEYAPTVLIDRMLDANILEFTACLVPMVSCEISLRCLILEEHRFHERRVFRRLGMCFVHHSHQDDLGLLPNPLKDMGLDFWDVGFAEEVEANKMSFVLV